MGHNTDAKSNESPRLCRNDETIPQHGRQLFKKQKGKPVKRADKALTRATIRGTMADIKNIKIIYAKGFLFLAVGLSASTLLILEKPNSKVMLLLILSVWCFARFYYFAFYVIGNYVDRSYNFSGLGSFALYLLRKKFPSQSH